MSVVIDGTTGVTAAAFDGALDGADLTGSVAASLLTGDVAAARIASALNATGSAPIFACRAWVNFDGTGTVAIRASGNVSSITDNGVGVYTVNFTTAMPDANYAVVFGGTGITSHPNSGAAVALGTSLSTSSFQMTTGNNGGAGSAGQLGDMTIVSVAIFR
jgi:hypothetical protein